jgi:transposase-like protein
MLFPTVNGKPVSAELLGIWKQEKKEDALVNLAAFKAKYSQRYPEAVRSLMEDEEHLLTFYAFPQVMHRYIRSTNAIESFKSLVRQRTEKTRCFYNRDELSDDCVGYHAGYSFAQNSGNVPAKHSTWVRSKQPADLLLV